MSEQPKGFWHRTWNDPLHFFFWLTMASGLLIILAIVFGHVLSLSNPPVWFQNALAIAAFCLIFGFLTGLTGVVLSFIPPVRRWLERVLRRRFFALACLVTVFVLLVAAEDWRGWHAWNSFKTEWEAKGEKFDWASVVPAAVPDDQNFAMSPVWIADLKYQFSGEPAKARAWYGDRIDRPEVLRLESLLPLSPWRTNDNTEGLKMGDWQVARSADLKPWQDYYRSPDKNIPAPQFTLPLQPQSPAADVLSALAKFDPLIDQLRQDSGRPESRFPIGYETEPDFEILLPHLAFIKTSSRTVQLHALAELEQGDTDKALADVHLMFRLVDSMRSEPFLISHLVRIAIFQTALQSVWQGCANHKWSDSQLVELQGDLAHFDFLADCQFALRGERSLAISTLDYSRRAGVWYGPDGGVLVSCQLVPSGFFYQNELTIAEMHQQFTLPLVDLENRTVSPRLVKESTKTANAQFKYSTPYNIFARGVLPALSNSIKRFAQAQADLDMARIALALERHHLAHGEYPANLDALTPQFIAQLPHDVIDGDPFHYRLTSDGQFVLYSVGWNATDDGGVVAFEKGATPSEDPNHGDWIWKYPAK